jgi:hypothetical protein
MSTVRQGKCEKGDDTISDDIEYDVTQAFLPTPPKDKRLD